MSVIWVEKRCKFLDKTVRQMLRDAWTVFFRELKSTDEQIDLAVLVIGDEGTLYLSPLSSRKSTGDPDYWEPPFFVYMTCEGVAEAFNTSDDTELLQSVYTDWAAKELARSFQYSPVQAAFRRSRVKVISGYIMTNSDPFDRKDATLSFKARRSPE